MVLKRRTVFWCLVVLLRFIYTIHPVACEPYNFIDDWNSKITSNKQPLLGLTNREHKLPPQSSRQAKDISEELQQLQLQSINNSTNESGLGSTVSVVVPCSVCTLGATLLQSAVKNGEPFKLIKIKFVSACVGFNIQNEDVCSGIFDVFGPDVLAVLNTTNMAPKEICTFLQSEACDEDLNFTHEWTVDLSESPKILLNTLEEKYLQLGKSTLKVLQISDTHLDLDYVEGSNANCDEPLCCRNSSSPKKLKGVTLPAGKWGAFNCDSPRILVENMLDNIAKNHPDVDYIIWTGDLPPHDIWKQTKNDSLNILIESVRQIKAAFPNTVILPSLGNHEGIPAGNFPPPWNKDSQHSIAWLYDEVNQQWKDWLPESERNSILRGGFYSVLLRPGFRIISINTNYCHIYSWWLVVNHTDPAKELDWLVDQLKQAELNNEKVHIIGHIPPGSVDCLKTWSYNYYNIVNRYEHVITAQFFGHTHSDEFEVFYDKNHTRPTNVAYIAPSVTPYTGCNPAFRLYYVDGEHVNSTWEVIDHETWILDLDKANSNLEENPEWFKLYSAREAYDMPNLSPHQWNKLIYRMIEDPKLFKRFYKFYHRDSPFSKKLTNKEKLHILCDLKSGKSQTRRKICRDLELMIHD